MPVIKAWEAKNIIVRKRGMGKSYAAIENFLFFDDKTRMLFGNAKDSIQALIGDSGLGTRGFLTFFSCFIDGFVVFLMRIMVTLS
ncbi:MAG: NAD(P)(+) transhydrogenase (Re/Si-specific) subunit beta [Bacteroidota bacterium]|nr:NAD(P)(+) transhydrogenase (Re/Si-specific) subunit beta [Bacteroidota bacterium]